MNTKRIVLSLITAGLLFPATAAANITGLSVTTVDFSAGYVLPDGSVAAGTGSAGALWSMSNLTTYRVWADVSNPLDTITMAGSGAGQPLILNSNDGLFVNSGVASAGDHPGSAVFMLFPTFESLIWDTWLTLGGATDITAGPFTDTNAASWGGLTGNVNALNTDWSLTTGSAGAVSDGAGNFRILLGQFTVATTGSEGINGWMRVQGFSSGFLNGVPFDEYLPFNSVPGPGSLLLFMLAGMKRRRRR